MATSDCTFTPVVFSSPSLSPLDFSNKLFCHVCGVRFMVRPDGATEATLYTCTDCCNSLRKDRDPQTAALLAQVGAEIDARVWRESFAGALHGEISKINRREA